MPHHSTEHAISVRLVYIVDEVELRRNGAKQRVVALGPQAFTDVRVDEGLAVSVESLAVRGGALAADDLADEWGARRAFGAVVARRHDSELVGVKLAARERGREQEVTRARVDGKESHLAHVGMVKLREVVAEALIEVFLDELGGIFGWMPLSQEVRERRSSEQ